MEWHVVEGGDGEEDARVTDNVRVKQENVLGSLCVERRAFGVGVTVGEAVWCAILLLRCCCCCLFACSDVG